MPTRERAAKATTECSHCHVAPGAECVDAQGRALDTIHAARMRAYSASAKVGRPAKAPTRSETGERDHQRREPQREEQTMGVDLNWYIPAQTRFRDVADAIATLLGHPTKFVNHGTYESCDVEGIDVDDKQMQPTCISFGLLGPDGKKYKHLLFQYESDGHPEDMIGPRVMLMRASGLNIALARRLVAFFGGALCECDCDGEISARHAAPFTRAPSDGQPWKDFERAKSEIKPVTAQEINEARKVAAYGDEIPCSMMPWLAAYPTP